MNTAKVIKTEADYQSALVEIEALMELNPRAGSHEANRLELLAFLADSYESSRFSLGDPDPLEAIRFRMEQGGLTARDLVPYIGSRSKVSEVLAGKRDLTLAMIRALHTGLGIPADALLRSQERGLLSDEIDWSKFPLRKMAARGWLQADAGEIRDRAEELMRQFLAPLGNKRFVYALHKRTNHVRSGRKMDSHALAAWAAYVVLQAEQSPPRVPFDQGSVTPDFLREVAKLSALEDGPLAAHAFLASMGIALVILPHLPQTHLDGAAMMSPSGVPVVGLTLRHDRVDNFWFCLLHELVHIARHLASPDVQFYDDLDSGTADDPREVEADQLAGEALIPTDIWERSPARILPSPDAAQHLASTVGVHPAIVAGRIQHESKNFKLLHQMVGRGAVRLFFPNVVWE